MTGPSAQSPHPEPDRIRGTSAKHVTTAELIAAVTDIAPDATALTGTTGPVGFAELHGRLAPTMAVFTARGVDAEAAVVATLSGVVSRPDRKPADNAAASRAAVQDVRSAAQAVLGSADWASLPGLLRITVRRYADRTAVSDAAGGALDYRELEHRSDLLARHLIGRGVLPGDVVGLAHPRTVDLVVAIVGVLKTGAAYLPLDISHPVQRLQMIVDDARPVLILTGDDLTEVHRLGVECVSVSEAYTSGAHTPGASPRGDLAEPALPGFVDARLAAYVIFTSGSTGRPKGVAVEHRNVVALMDAARREFSVDENDVWSMFHSYAFDFSVWELWGPLLTGGRLVLIDRDVARDPARFLAEVAAQEVTVLSQTPSAFYQLIDARRLQQSQLCLRYIVFGGETLSFEQVRRWFDENPDDPARLVNMYGITETTVHVTVRELDAGTVSAGRSSFVGGALRGLRVHILDSVLKPVPPGVTGEIYVSGGQLARGYLGRPELSASRFVADPFGAPGERMYRSGDLARYKGDDIEYLGRGDAQVQLRGYRIEFGEVEAALLALPGVVGAAAAVKGQREGLEQLVGYLVTDTRSQADIEIGSVRGFVAARVPDYMVPDVVVALESLPLNVNGKLDRAALPEPQIEAVDFVAPASVREQRLATIVADVIGAGRIGVTDPLLDLGVNSLIAAQIAARAAEELDLPVGVRDIFSAATVRELSELLGGRAAVHRPALKAVARPDVVPLSYAQRRLWFLAQMQPGPLYNIPFALRLRGDLRPADLEAALHEVIDRHETLRTRFPVPDGTPQQEIAPPGYRRSDIEVASPTAVPGTDVDALVADVAGRGFDLAAAAPVRARLFRIADDDHVFVLVMHHVISDGGSVAPFARDLMLAYNARSDRSAKPHPSVSGPTPLPVQYADYALWQRELLGDPYDPQSVGAAQLDYWAAELDGAPEVISLPTDRRRPPEQSGRAGAYTFDLPEDLFARTEEFARSQGVSLFMVLHTAVVVALHRLGAGDDIVVGTPYAGRGERGLHNLVGMFVNTVVLRVPLTAHQDFESVLHRVRDVDLSALDHADIPFEMLVERIRPTRDRAHAPLCQVMINVQDIVDTRLELDGVTADVVEQHRVLTDLDLSMSFLRHRADHSATPRLSVILEYATDLFDPATIGLIGAAFESVLTAGITQPATVIGDIEIGSPVASDVDAAREGGEIPDATTSLLGEQMLAQADRTPDAVALISDDRVMTYAEFSSRVVAFTRTLIACGVRPEVPVGVCMARSPEVVVAVHAIALAGGHFVPIDPHAPAARVAHVLSSTEIRWVIGADGPPPECIKIDGVDVVTLSCDGPSPTVAPFDPGERRSPLHPDNAAYTLFTSGSTGKPKSVTISHRSITVHLDWVRQAWAIVPDDVVMFATPPTFDPSVWQIFGPLTVGAAVSVARADVDPRYLLGRIRDSGVTVYHTVPSLLAEVAEECERTGVTVESTLRLVISGGESLDAGLARRVRAVFGVDLVNSYGPTEATITSNQALVQDEWPVIPLGDPVRGSVALVLDERLHRVPAGVAGELYLGGVRLSRGYTGAAALTAGRFVADPYGRSGERIYRTGDRVRRTRDGRLEYLGRNDFQVKIRGQRIELEEVERAIAGIDGVRSAAATVALDTRSGAPRLVGYVQAEPGVAIDTSRLSLDVGAALPGYMCPSAWVVLDVMPQTPSGKLDRKALPEPEFEVREFVAPQNPAEEAVAAVFAGVLGVDQVSVVESFFDLGGNSLSAMRIVSRVGDALDTEITVRDVFDTPSVRALVAAIEGAALRPVDRRRVNRLTPVRPRPEFPPLSYAQQRLWFINRFDPDSGAYNIPEVVRLLGPLDPEALRAAVVAVVVRHEILRTTFDHVDGVGYQRVSDAAEVDARLDWAVLHTAVDMRRASSAGFDLAHDWPIRVRLRRIGADEHEFSIVVHHIACDGESVASLVADLLEFYRAGRAGRPARLAPLDVQYVDYALWQRDELGEITDPDSVLSRQLDYWRQQLSGTPDLLSVPTSRPRPEVADRTGGRIDFAIPPELARRVEQLARETGATTFMVLHAALAVLLSRLGAEDDIAVATPVSGRGDRRLDGLVGMFVNTLVLRVRVDGAESMTELLRRVRTTDLDALAQADVPFEAVVDAVGPVRSTSFSPFTEVMLSVDPAGGLAGLDEVTLDGETPDGRGGDGLRVRATPHAVPVQRDLTFAISTRPHRGIARSERSYSGALLFATSLFDDELAETLVGRYLNLLDDLTGDPSRPVGDAEMLDLHEAATIRRWSSGAPVTLSPPATLAELAVDAARYGADDCAIVAGDQTLSFGEFTALVNSVAREMITHGVAVDQAVAVWMDRSVELVVALHAVAVAGAQYVPLDPAGPLERNAAILSDSAAVLILTGPGTPNAVSSLAVAGLHVDAAERDRAASADPVTDADRNGVLHPDNGAYTLFTSGSTGRPKGVTVSHRSIMNRLWWMAENYGIGPSDRILQKTPATFDVSVWEFFLPLLTRGVLVVAEPDGHRDPRYLAEVISAQRVSVAHFVPSMLSVFTAVSGARTDQLGSLRLLFTSGEALTAPVASSARAIMPRAQLHNLYGPTEAAVDVTAWTHVPGSAVIPIGSPVWNTRTLVLDNRLAPVPTGVTGELYLAGIQLARGYVARPELTATAFVADPYGPPGARMYRTGDRVRWSPDGQLEYRGRTDFQVKIRGQRTELGEIEAVLAAVPGVVHCAVVLASAPSGDLLIGYVGHGGRPDSDDHAVSTDDLDEAVRRELPEHMRPGRWVLLESMPLTASGKVDRRALPEPDVSDLPTGEHVAAATPAEAELAAIVADVLGVGDIGVTTSFFTAGGHSLAAMRVVARAADTLGVEVSVRDLFDKPTVRELATLLAGREGGPERVTAGPRPDRLPLSATQRRMWFINQFDTTDTAYNITSALRVSTDVDLGLLADAVGDVVARHEVLRTLYPADATGPHQRIVDEQTARVMLDWAVTDDPAELADSASAGFDVSVDLPLRGRVYRGADGTDVVITVHHIAFDGRSRAVLVDDLMDAYTRRIDGLAPAGPLPIQYADYALFQENRLSGDRHDRQMSYWRSHLAGIPEVTDVALDRPRPAVMDTRGARLPMVVGDETAEAITEFARRHGITPFMAVHAAFAITLGRLAATDDVVIGSVVAGRDDPALEKLIGMFVGTVVLRTRVEPSTSVADFVAEVRQTDVDAFANADVSFDDLVDELVTDRSASFAPLVQIGFSYVGAETVGDSDLPGAAALESIDLSLPPSVKLDLQLTVGERSDSSPMCAEITYASALFDESTVARIGRAWIRVMRAMAADDTRTVGDIELLDDHRRLSTMRRSSLGADGSAPDGGVAEPRPVIEILRSAPRRPDHPALICGDTVIDYAEFEAHTNRVARALIARGVGVDDVVAVGVQRSIASVSAIVGVLKAGAAFVAIDPAYPLERIDHMITDSGVRIGLTTREDRNRLGESGCGWLDLEDLAATDGDRSGDSAPITDDELGGRPRVDNLAYLVYTSGSTGLPKAVAVSGRGIANLLAAQNEIVESGPRESQLPTRVLHVASTSFDAAVFEILYAIGAGHTLVIAGESEYAGQALTHIINRHQVTDMVITPTVLQTVDITRAVTVTNLSVAGEACPPELVRRVTAAPTRNGSARRRMFNLYGPSETTVWASTGRLEADRAIRIGRGIRGFTTHVLDARLHHVPDGVVGELYLGSPDSLARGYLNQPGRSATSFVADPFSTVPGARMYATGDLARVRPDGELEFAGRADGQIKVNGQRIELGEIEAVLTRSPRVSAAVVRGVETSAGRTALVAYVVGVQNSDEGLNAGSLDVEALRADAARILASHLIPHQIIEIDALPLTPGGKLDVRALPDPFGTRTGGFGSGDLRSADALIAEPETHEEVTLARIVAGLIGADRVDVTESFFTLGGDSILSIQLSSAARAAGLPITPREIFEHRTVRAMARAARESAATLVPLEEDPTGGVGDLPLPTIVSWMLEHAASQTDFADFSQSTVLTAPPELTAVDLAEMLDALAGAHPMLTARLVNDRGGWHLEVSGEFDAPAAVREVRLGTLPGDTSVDDAIRLAHATACRELDPSAGDLVRAVLLWSADGTGRVVLVIHHLAVDAVSWPVLIEDLLTAWTQLSGRGPIELRAEATSMRAWTTALARRGQVSVSERAYWLRRLPQVPTVLGRVSTSHDGPADRDSLVTLVSPTVTESVLTAVPDALRARTADVLLGALARAVRGWQAGRNIDDSAPVSVLVEGHGRYEDVLSAGPDPRVADLSRTVGWFTTIAPMAIEPGPDVVHAVKAAKEERHGIPGHGIGFGLLRYGSGRGGADRDLADREVAARPLPSIGFNYLGAAGGAGITQETPWLPAPGAPRLAAGVSGANVGLAQLTLDISVVPAGPGGSTQSRSLRVDFGYAGDVLDRDDVTRIARIFSAELAEIAELNRRGVDLGISPTDVPGESVTQDDLDDLASRFPGAEVWGLSPLQKGLYFHSQLGAGDGVDVYLTQAILRLEGAVDIDRLRWAAEALLRNHRVLRSGFVRTAGGQVVAVIPERVQMPWSVVENVDVGPVGHAETVREVAEQQRRTPFVFDDPPLLRVVVVGGDHGAGESEPGETAVVITAHHLLFDGWSGPLVLGDLLSLYATGATYTSGAGDFADHLARLAEVDTAAGLAAWRRVLEPLDGPTLVAPGAVAALDALPADHTAELPGEVTAALERVAATHGATLATVLQLAWAILMSRMTGSRVVSFGEIVSGRPADLDGVAHMIGLFVNTVPVVVDVDPDASVSSALSALQHNKIAVLDHQHLGLSDIAAQTGFGQLFDTVVVHESYPVDTEALAGFGSTDGGLTVAGIEAGDSTHYPLNLSTAPRGNGSGPTDVGPAGLRLTLKYLPSAFDDRHVSVLIESLTAILTAIAYSPATATGDVLLLARDHASGSVSGGVPTPPRTLAELFAGAAERGGDAVAVVDPGGARLTYAELDRRSNRLARLLITRGVGPEDLVALAIGRSIDLMVAIWAVAKAGAGYVPIDPDYPAERITLIATDCHAVLGLTVTAAGPAPDTGYQWLVVDAPDLAADIAGTPDDVIGSRELVAPVRTDNVAFVIYTSGSTGRPKGVAVTHHGLANVAATEVTRLQVDADSVVMGFATPSFDASVFEYLMAFGATARLVYRPADAVGGRDLEEFITDNAVTHGFLTPSVLATIDPVRVPHLSAVVVGGEAVPPRLVAEWAGHVRLHDGYGPTETTIVATLGAALKADDRIDIGTPMPGADLYVLDARLHPVPPGFAGELYLGSSVLARGYARRPGITASRFIANPFATSRDGGERLYRTGDEVRWTITPAGSMALEYLGRTDFQVKLRGLRIELGEIEAVLDEHPAVEASAVIGVGGSVAKALAAYVVVNADVPESDLRRFVAERLPVHMVPSTISVLDALPLTPVGKVDRNALPEPALVVGAFAPAQSQQEVLVAAAFSEVLDLDRVSVTESFFDVGGNSLSATRVAARVSAALDAEVTVRDVFDAPTVRELTRRLVGRESGLAPLIAKETRPQPIPLSFAQTRMWFVNRFDADAQTGAYNIPIGVRLTGDLDVEALRQAIGDVVARHEILRTTFPAHDGRPQQVIHPVSSPVAQPDWAVVDSADDLVDAARAGFDVTTEVPLRVRLLPTGDDEWILLAVIHHMIGDGESMQPLVTDIGVAYLARVQGGAPQFEPLPVQFADVAIWQHETFGDPDDPDSVVGRSLRYWEERLDGISDVVALPTDRPRPPVASHRGAVFEFEIPAELAERIADLAGRASATPFMVLHTALALTVARMAADPDVVIATPVAGRGQAELDGLVGMFVNTVVLRTQMSADSTFAELLAAVRAADLDAFTHSQAPFEMVVDRCHPVRSQAFAPLAQVMLNVLARPATPPVARFGGLSVQPVAPPVVPAQLDLSVQVSVTDGAGPPGKPWTGSVVYATDLFDESTVADFVDALRRILAAGTDHPSRPIDRLELTDPAQLQRVLACADGPQVAATRRGTIVDLVTRQVAGTPDREAVVFGDRTLTYREFGARTAILARELIAAGVGPEVAVGVWMDRGPELMIAVHAVVAAGGQYVPFTPDVPLERLRYQRDVVGIGLFLVGAGADTDIGAGFGDVTVIEVDSTTDVDLSVPLVDDTQRRSPLRGGHPAYTLFTSGSTGRPKGVTVTHDSLFNVLSWCSEFVDVPAEQRMLVKAPTTFDVSVVEMFWPSTVGACAVVAEPDGHRDPVYLGRLAQSQRVTVVQFVPAMLSAFLDAVESHDLEMPSLRHVLCGGEALSAAYAGRCRRLLDVAVVNKYGPTEATIDLTHHTVTGEETVVPIGVPGWNTRTLVLDARLQPVPVGVVGELYLGGTPLARGYAGRADLTAQHFVADPIGEPGDRLYRTGDRVRWNTEGELEYLGRNDFQVKLRGQRIELGEIEAVINAVRGVTHAAAAVRDDSGEYLTGYFAPATVPVEVVADEVALRLPEYMRPTAWVPLDVMPVSTAGKIDRRALPAPELGAAQFVAPRSETEALVAGIVADVLGDERVGVTDSFFDIGGHSLSAMRFAARTSQALGVEVSVRDVFEYPSVRGLVEAVGNRGAGTVALAPPESRPDRIPLSLAQQRIWFINHFDPSSGTYNVPMVLRLSGPLDVTALREAVVDVMIRHEILRTRFPAPEGVPVQIVEDPCLVRPRLDWAVVGSDDELGDAVTEGFDVAHRWPIRVRVRRLAADDHVLAVVIHHIATDGESLRPLMTDLVAAYDARHCGDEPHFTPLAVQFADFAIWQRAVLGEPDDPSSTLGGQLDYWRGQLSGLPAVLELPADRPRPEVASGRAARFDFAIPESLGSRIDAIAREFGATPFMVLHAGLVVLLARCSGTTDVAVGTPVAGRGRRELDAMVGMFVNTLVLRTGYLPEETFADLLHRVRTTDLDALAHSDVPFDTLVDTLNPARSEAFAPLVQVLLSYQRQAAAEDTNTDEAEIAGLRVAPVGTGAGAAGGAELLGAKTDLLFGIGARDGDEPWHGSIIYATDLFDEPSMSTLAQRFVAVLDQLTASPTIAVGDTDLFVGSPTAQHRPIVGAPGEQPTLLRDMFADAVRRHPERPAVIDASGDRLTYVQLDRDSGRLAHWLAESGIGPESLVALAIGRSVHLSVAIWAVAKTGAGYVPIDPDYPAERVANMVADSGAILGLCLGDSGALPDNGFRWVSIDRPEFIDDIVRRPQAVGEARAVRPDNVAYVIYTSGSTGRPKGVSVSHRGLADFARSESVRLEAGDAPVVLGFASPSFDASVLEYLLATTNGGVVVYRPADAPGGPSLAEFIRSHGVTHTFLTPSVLATLDPTELPSLRSLAVGGEPVGRTVVENWSPYAAVRNLYGPTETTIGVTISAPLRPGYPVDLGTPLNGVGLMVLDERLHPVPAGVPGELYVSGPALSRGYLQRPGLTGSRFVAGVFGRAGERMYRTGDVVRWWPDDEVGTRIEYDGRGDDQIKVRGLRIEPGEIEATLIEHSAVDSAAVVAVGAEASNSLAAYVVASGRGPIDVGELTVWLAQRLPAHLVPATITVLDALPLTPVGKLDRRALPTPLPEDVEYCGPETDLEAQVATAYGDVLGLEQVSVTASFFELGGNSLAATQVLARLRPHHPDIQLSWVFRSPTVRGLAARISGGNDSPRASDGRDVLLALRSEGSRTPLFCVHPAGGLAWFYGGLVRHLPDRPVYGLQDPHVVAGEEQLGSVEELAQRYLSEIRRVAPHGPYHLLGWSLGGYVVHEIAVRLQADGEELGFVGVMDASPGAADLETSRTRPGGEVVADALAGWRDLFDLGPDVTASDPEQVAAVVREQIAATGLLGADEVARVMNSFEHAAQIVADHRPRTGLATPMLVFTATRDKPEPERIARGWEPYVDAAIRNVDVDVNHLGMAEERALEVIGPEIAAVLAAYKHTNESRREDQR